MATVLTVAEFRGYFGLCFADSSIYPDAMIQAEIDNAGIEVTESIYRDYYKRAAYNMAAHFVYLMGERNRLMKLSPMGGAAAEPQGMMSNSGAGDISTQFDFPNYSIADDKFLASTVYGQEYVRLKRKMGKGGLVTGNGLSPVIVVSPMFNEGTW